MYMYAVISHAIYLIRIHIPRNDTHMKNGGKSGILLRHLICNIILVLLLGSHYDMSSPQVSREEK